MPKLRNLRPGRAERYDMSVALWAGGVTWTGRAAGVSSAGILSRQSL